MAKHQVDILMHVVMEVDEAEVMDTYMIKRKPTQREMVEWATEHRPDHPVIIETTFIQGEPDQSPVKLRRGRGSY